MCLKSSNLNLVNVSSFLMLPYSQSIAPFNDDSNPISGNVGVWALKTMINLPTKAFENMEMSLL